MTDMDDDHVGQVRYLVYEDGYLVGEQWFDAFPPNRPIDSRVTYERAEP